MASRGITYTLSGRRDVMGDCLKYMCAWTTYWEGIDQRAAAQMPVLGIYQEGPKRR